MIKKLFFAVFSLLCALAGFSQNLPLVTMETQMGKIVCEIDTIHAPLTALNFLNHIQNKTFTNAFFYRVVRPDNQAYNKIKIEVIQGGLFHDAEIEKYSPIAHETTQHTGLKHRDGALSMARNEPGSASTEFFICIGGQPELDFGGKRNADGQGFAVFGHVVEGMEVVRKIQMQKDTSQYLVDPVKLEIEYIGN